MLFDIAQGGLSAPLDVQFDITGKCQLSCSYCCAAPLDQKDVETRKAVSIIGELSEARVYSVLLLGGEPTLHPGFIEILGAAASSIPMVSFGSNGIRLAKGNLASEVKHAAPGAMVTISLDSLDQAIHNSNRGAANRAIEAIEKCCTEGLTVSIS